MNFNLNTYAHWIYLIQRIHLNFFKAFFKPTLLFVCLFVGLQLSAQQNCGSVTDPVTGCNVFYCDGVSCDDLVPADGVFTCTSCEPCGVESPPSDRYACARVELDVTGTTEYMNDPTLAGCSLDLETQENGNFDFYLLDGSVSCGTPDFSIGDGGSFPLTILSGGMVEFLVCKTGNAGRRDLNITLSCCEPNADCISLPDIDEEGCSNPLPFTDYNSVFVNVEACGAAITMDYEDVGDQVICGDGDGSDFVRTYTLYFDGVPVATCDQNIQINDTTPPVMTCPEFEDTFFACPVGIGPNTPTGDWFEIGPFGMIDVAAGGIYITTIDVNNCISDNCSTLSEIEYSLENSYQEDVVPGCSITIVNELRIRDECQNLSADLITVRITIQNNSTTPPSISCPADVSVACGAPTDPSSTGMATGSDDCGDVTITFSDNQSPGCGNTGTITRTWKATNGCGIMNTCTQIITITDNTPPTINCPPDLDLQCGSSTDPNATGTATGSDNCGSVTISFSDNFAAGCGSGTGIITRTWTATDECGLTASCDQVLTITDDTPPLIVCPADATVECGGDTSPNATGTASGSDDCGGVTITFTDSSQPGCGNTETITRTWTATNDCGLSSSCDQVINVVDTTPPSITCPPDATVSCGGDTSPNATGTATASDNCGSVSISFNDVFAPSCGTGTGMITRTWTATDACGLTSSCEQIIVIIDNTPPSITCPPDVTVECGGDTSPNATGTATGSDDCGTVTITSSDSFSPACGNTGTITRTWTATDECGLSSTCQQLIVIVDTSPPTIVCPADVTVECGAPTDPAATGMATGSDVCGGVTITFDDNFDPACGNTGVITRTWTATDDCGLSSSCDQIITIVDNTPPTIVCPADVTVECGDPTDPAATGMATGSDVCGSVTITFNDSFDPACGNTGVITRTWTATDDCGQSATCDQIITIVDTQSPTIEGPFPDGFTMEVECNLLDETWTAFEDMTDDLIIEDACSDVDDITLTYEDVLIEEGVCGVSDFLSIWRCTWTATDECGNSSTYTIFVRIVDTEGPSWTFFPPDVGILCEDEIPFQQPTAVDNCSGVEISYQDTNLGGDCEGSYTIRRRWTAVDGCGNPTVDDQFITITDETAPEIFLIDEYVSGYVNGQEVYVDCGDYSKITKLKYAARAYDACIGAVEVDFTYEDFGLFDCAEFGYMGHLETTWTASDDCGNTSSITIYWYLTDTTPPTFQGFPADACVDELPPIPMVTAVDDCEFAYVEFSESDPIDCEGGQYVERTWTATDVCGNSISATQRLTFTGAGGPSISVDYPGLEGLASGSTGVLEADCDENGALKIPDILSSVSVMDGCSGSNAIADLVLLDEGDCSAGYLARYALRASARDACGNMSDYELFIEIVDTTPPVISGPAEITIGCGEEIAGVSAQDACSEVVSIDFMDSDPIEVSCPDNPRNFERIWTAVDGCGNTSVFAQSITIIDADGPIFRNVPEDACNDTSLDEDVVAYDECEDTEIPVELTETTASVNGCGEVLTRIWTATDGCGNVSTAMQQVFFTDELAPRLSFAHSLLFGLEDGDELVLPVDFNFGNPQEIYDFGEDAISVEDNCATDLATVLSTIYLDEAEDCATTGYLSRILLTWTATDPCGNSASISIILVYEDTYGPEIYGVEDDVLIYCEDPIPPVPEVTLKDNYDVDVELDFSQEYIDTAEGVRLVRTWTATDDCGNVTVETQNITIIDNSLTCDFSYSPEEVDCNSRDNFITVNVGGGTAPYTYSWEMVDCDGFLTSDPTQQTVRYTIGYTTQNFSVTITDANGCERICTTSIECEKEDEVLEIQTEETTAVGLYPNPVTDQLQVRLDQLAEKQVSIRIYSLLGQLMVERNLQYWPVEGITIDTGKLPAGTYLVRIETAEGSPITKEIVVIR